MNNELDALVLGAMLVQRISNSIILATVSSTRHQCLSELRHNGVVKVKIVEIV
jgi:hypothetical protein